MTVKEMKNLLDQVEDESLPVFVELPEDGDNKTKGVYLVCSPVDNVPENCVIVGR